MKRPVGVRAVRLSDAGALAALYRYYVEETAISFEYAAPDAAEFRRRIEKTAAAGYPYFVAVYRGEIIGYAYAGPFIPRAAYDCSAELSIYVKRGETGKGVGKLLYRTMERTLKKQGITHLYACIAYPEGEDPYVTMNSVEYHYHMGYAMAGYFKDCAEKFGRKYSMVWMEKSL